MTTTRISSRETLKASLRRALTPLLGVFTLAACSSDFTDATKRAYDGETSCLGWDGPPADTLPSLNVDGCVRPKFFGHRGSWKSWAPENTLAAFQCGIDQGADGVEIDLQITLDNVVVAIHDYTPNRTTNASDAPRVDEMTFAELRELDAGSWFDPAFAGAQVPSIDEVLDLIAPTGVEMMFDVKSTAVIEQLVPILRKRGLIDRSLVSSHKYSTLEAAYEADPSLRLLYYIPSLDELESLSIPSIEYVRVPKSVAGSSDAVDRIVAAGYQAAIGEYRVDYSHGMGLVDNMDAVWDRVRGKVPDACG
jgi:glycerophosphoryl diester phosphodiesterase